MYSLSQSPNSFHPYMFNTMSPARRRTRKRSTVRTIKFPSLVSPRYVNNLRPHERVIYDAYNELCKSKHQVTEKSTYYSGLYLYLIKQCKHKPICMSRTDWSNDLISLSDAIETFKSYYDYMEDYTARTLRRRETVKQHEVEVFAKLFEKGDTERMGWDKSDVFDIIGKHSASSAYYLIEKYGISRHNRLQFGEFLRSALPEHKTFDESNAYKYYPRHQRD